MCRHFTPADTDIGTPADSTLSITLHRMEKVGRLTNYLIEFSFDGDFFSWWGLEAGGPKMEYILLYGEACLSRRVS